MTPQLLFRRVAIAEAVTWALLLLGMVLKYVTHTTELGVRVFGMAHGVVFITYCLSTLFVAVNQRWSARETLLGLVSAVPPFMTVWFDRRAERRGELGGGWRLVPGGEQPGSLAERLQAWLLARPLAATGAAVVAVAVLTAVALLVGPPVGSQS
jgi:integral membrane protein